MVAVVAYALLPARASHSETFGSSAGEETSQQHLISEALRGWLVLLLLVQALQVPLRVTLHRKLSSTLLDQPRAAVVAHLLALVGSPAWRWNKFAGNVSFALLFAGSLLVSWASSIAGSAVGSSDGVAYTPLAETVEPRLLYTTAACIAFLAGRMVFSLGWFVVNYVLEGDQRDALGYHPRAVDQATIQRLVAFYAWGAPGTPSAAALAAKRAAAIPLAGVPVLLAQPSSQAVSYPDPLLRADHSARAPRSPSPQGPRAATNAPTSTSARARKALSDSALSDICLRAQHRCSGEEATGSLASSGLSGDSSGSLLSRAIAAVQSRSPRSPLARTRRALSADAYASRHWQASAGKVTDGAVSFVLARERRAAGSPAADAMQHHAASTPDSLLVPMAGPPVPREASICDEVTAQPAGEARSDTVASQQSGSVHSCCSMTANCGCQCHQQPQPPSSTVAKAHAARLRRLELPGPPLAVIAGGQPHRHLHHVHSASHAAQTLALRGAGLPHDHHGHADHTGHAGGVRHVPTHGPRCRHGGHVARPPPLRVAVPPGSGAPPTSAGAAPTPAPSPASSVATETCAVCLADFEAGEDVAELPCSPMHVFHRECVVPWLRKERRCPLCVTDIDEPQRGAGRKGTPIGTGAGRASASS